MSLNGKTPGHNGVLRPALSQQMVQFNTFGHRFVTNSRRVVTTLSVAKNWCSRKPYQLEASSRLPTVRRLVPGQQLLIQSTQLACHRLMTKLLGALLPTHGTETASQIRVSD